MADGSYTDTEISELVASMRLQADMDGGDIDINEFGETDDYEMSYEGVADNLRKAADVIEYLLKMKKAV